MKKKTKLIIVAVVVVIAVIAGSFGAYTVIGTVLVRTSNKLMATQQKELEQKVIDALTRLE